MLKKLTMKPKAGPVKKAVAKEQVTKDEDKKLGKIEEQKSTPVVESEPVVLQQKQELTAAQSVLEVSTSTESKSNDGHANNVSSLCLSGEEIKSVSDIVVPHEPNIAEPSMKQPESPAKKPPVKKSLLSQMMVKPKMIPKKPSTKDVVNCKQHSEGSRNKILDETHTTDSFVRPPEPLGHKIKKPPLEKSLLAQMTGKPKMVPKKPSGKSTEKSEDIDKQKPTITLSREEISVEESIPQMTQNVSREMENEVDAVEFSAKEAETESENLKLDDVREKHKSPAKSAKSQMDGSEGKEDKIINEEYDPDVDSSMVSEADDPEKKKKKRKTRRGLNPEYEEFYNLKEKFLERLAVEGEDEIDPTQLSISELCFYSHEYIDKLKPQVDELLEKKKKKMEKARVIKGEQEEDKEKEKENKVIVKGVEVEKPEEKEPEPAESAGPLITVDEEGNFQVDLDSLEFETAESLAEKRALQNQTVLYDSRNTEYNRFGKLKKRRKRTVFSPKETAKFYTALSLIGPNFDKMTQFFPQYTRDDLHNKFKIEDRKNPDFITSLLKNVKFDVDIYGELLDSTDEENEEEENEKTKDRKKEKAKKEKKKEPKPEKIKRQKVGKEEQKTPKARKPKLDGETAAKKRKEKAARPKGFADYEPSGHVKKETQKKKSAKKSARAISRLSVGENDENTIHGCDVNVDLGIVTDVEIDLDAATDIEIDPAIFDQFMKKRERFEHETPEDGQDGTVESGDDFGADDLAARKQVKDERSVVHRRGLAEGPEQESEKDEEQTDFVTENQERMVKIADEQQHVVIKQDLIAERVIENTETLSQDSSSALVIDETVHCTELQEIMQEYSEAYADGIDAERPEDDEEELTQSEENVQIQNNANSFDDGDNSILEPQEILPHDIRVKTEELIVPDRKVVIRIKPTGPVSFTPVVPKLVTPPVGFVPRGSVNTSSPDSISSNMAVIDAKLCEHATDDDKVKDACIDSEKTIPSGGKEVEHKASKFKSSLLKSVATPVNVKRKDSNQASVLEGLKESPSPEGSELTSSADQKAPTKATVRTSSDSKVASKFAKSGMLKSLTSKPLGLKKKIESPSSFPSPCLEPSGTSGSASLVTSSSPALKGKESASSISSPTAKKLVTKTEAAPLMDALFNGTSNEARSNKELSEPRMTQKMAGLHKPLTTVKTGSQLLKRLSLKPLGKEITNEKARTVSHKMPVSASVIENSVSKVDGDSTLSNSLPSSVIEELCPRKRKRSSSGPDECKEGYDTSSFKRESLVISSDSATSKMPKLASPVKSSLGGANATASRTVRPAVKRASKIQEFKDSESSNSEDESSFITQPTVKPALVEQANNESNSSEPQVRERAILTSAETDSSSSFSLLSKSVQRQSCVPPKSGVKQKLLSFKDCLKKPAQLDDRLKGVGQPSSELSTENKQPVQPWSSPLSSTLEPTQLPTSVIPPESLRELANVPAGSIVLVEVPNPINPSEKVIQVFQKFD